jgi:hypothetical protein
MEATMNTPLEVALDISSSISEAKLDNSLLDVSSCAERISRRHPLADCSKEAIEETLEDEGAAAGIAMRLAARRRSH